MQKLRNPFSWLNSCANPVCAERHLSTRLFYSGLHVGQRRYCSPACVQAGLQQTFEELLHRPKRVYAKRQHRIPLGLALMSRGQIDPETLKNALREQRRTPGIRLGQILITMGAVTEEQVTCAVASQWSVPVFRLQADYVPPAAQLVPFMFMQRYKMLPVHFVSQRKHMHLAFADVIDRKILYEIEQTLGVTTEASIAPESVLMRLITAAAQQSRPPEYVINNVAEEELPQLVAGYAFRLHAEQIRMMLCDSHIWACASRKNQPVAHFLLKLNSLGALAQAKSIPVD